MQRLKVLVFIVAYNAEKTIKQVVSRIPRSLRDTYDVDVLIIDDCSRDSTFAEGRVLGEDPAVPFPLTVLVNPVNQGYGGNQKLGYHYALLHGYDFVAMVHGDGQYAPEYLPTLLEPLRTGVASAVFGSRMLRSEDALRGGMPKYKFLGNKILTWIENKLLHANLSEFHSGYRIYATRALERIPFDRNSNDFHFDTEIITQLLIAELKIVELPIPTYYGDEICHVNGTKYAWNVVVAALQARLQDVGLFYDRRFDCKPSGSSPYRPKFEYTSPHSLAFDRAAPGSVVLDIGCAGGYLDTRLTEEKHCTVDAIDACPIEDAKLRGFYLHNLDRGLPQLNFEQYDLVLMLDVIEHLRSPERFLDELREALKTNPQVEVILSTANVAFLITRLMLLIGQFNYGKRGILDLTHTRLFTFRSFRRLARQAGFDVLESVGVPGPVPLALGDSTLSRFLLRVNQMLIHVAPGLFAYQIFLRIKARPSLDLLLKATNDHTQARSEAIEVMQNEAKSARR